MGGLSSAPTDIDDPFDDEAEGLSVGEVVAVLDDDSAQGRLDKVLAGQFADVSRARLQALIAAGALSRDGTPVLEPASKAIPGRYVLRIPAPIAAEPEPQDIPLTVLFEDAHLIVIDKAAGLAVHPAPGHERGTLVNA